MQCPLCVLDDQCELNLNIVLSCQYIIERSSFFTEKNIMFRLLFSAVIHRDRKDWNMDGSLSPARKLCITWSYFLHFPITIAPTLASNETQNAYSGKQWEPLSILTLLTSGLLFLLSVWMHFLGKGWLQLGYSTLPRYGQKTAAVIMLSVNYTLREPLWADETPAMDKQAQSNTNSDASSRTWQRVQATSPFRSPLVFPHQLFLFPSELM